MQKIDIYKKVKMYTLKNSSKNNFRKKRNLDQLEISVCLMKKKKSENLCTTFPQFHYCFIISSEDLTHHYNLLKKTFSAVLSWCSVIIAWSALILNKCFFHLSLKSLPYGYIIMFHYFGVIFTGKNMDQVCELNSMQLWSFSVWNWILPTFKVW